MNLGAPRVEVTRGSSLWLVPQGAVFEFSFHAIHSIALKFTIDKHTESMAPLRVLSRTNLAGSSPSTSFASSISFISFRLSFSLCALFRAPTVCLQQLRDSFRKTPGVAYSFGNSSAAPKRKNASL